MNKITPPHELADEVLDVAAASAISVMNCSIRAPAERADEALDAGTDAVPCIYLCGCMRGPAELSDEVLDAATAAITTVACACYVCGRSPADLSDEVLDASPEARPCWYCRYSGGPSRKPADPDDKALT